MEKIKPPIVVAIGDASYSRAESNCYQKFRKLLFYPLNYRSIIFVMMLFGLQS